jgi:transposase
MSAAWPNPYPSDLDPAAIEILKAMKQAMDQQTLELQKKNDRLDQQLALAEMKIQSLMEELRLERIKRYGKRSEKLSDLQLQLLDDEPAVSSEEIEAESRRDPLPESSQEEQTDSTTPLTSRPRKPHPGRNTLPAHLERVEKVVSCTEAQCTCGKCGGKTDVIGYETTEVLDMKPVEFFVTVIKREKRACKNCIRNGVQTAPAVQRILPKTLFSDAVTIDFVVRKYCDAQPLYRQQATLRRDLDLDVALTTINDAVLRVGDLLIPVVDRTLRDLLAGDYIQADETWVGVQTEEKKGENHTGYFWQYSAPGKGVVFDFRMTRSGEVPKEVFKDYSGILQTDGYAGYEKDVGTERMTHACCFAHSRRKFIEAVKVATKGKATDRELERVVTLMDGLFAIDREASEQKLSLADRHVLRQERAPVILTEMYELLLDLRRSTKILPKSRAGMAVAYTLNRWQKLTVFMKHPVIELSTNWAENSMRPIAVGRKNWLHLGSEEAGPKIAAIFSIVESCRKLNVPIRQYLADILPGLADRSIHSLDEITPAAYAAKMAK